MRKGIYKVVRLANQHRASMDKAREKEKEILDYIKEQFGFELTSNYFCDDGLCFGLKDFELPGFAMVSLGTLIDSLEQGCVLNAEWLKEKAMH